MFYRIENILAQSTYKNAELYGMSLENLKEGGKQIRSERAILNGQRLKTFTSFLIECARELAGS